MSVTQENGGTGRLFKKVKDPVSLLPILESRLPLSCCLVNQILAYEAFKDTFVAYVFQETTSQDTSANNLILGENTESGYDQSTLWILFNARREDWNRCITVSSPSSAEIPSEVKYAFEHSEILNWDDPFVFLNLDPNLSDFLINLNLRKFGNVIKIYPCYLFYMDPQTATKLEVPSPSDPTVTIGPLDPLKGAEFLTKHNEYAVEGQTHEYILKCASNHISAGVYLANGELACAAFTAPYGNINCLVTHKDHRRKGYGSMVMRYIVRELGKRGFHPNLETGMRNTAGKAFHAKYVPRIIGQVDNLCHKAP